MKLAIINPATYASPSAVACQVVEGATNTEGLLDQRAVGQLRAVIHEYAFDPSPQIITNLTPQVVELVTNGFSNRLKAHVRGRRTYISSQVIDCTDMGANAYAALKSIRAVKKYAMEISDNVQQTSASSATPLQYLGVSSDSPDWTTTLESAESILVGILQAVPVTKNWRRIIDKWIGFSYEKIRGTKVAVLSMIGIMNVNIAGVTGFLSMKSGGTNTSTTAMQLLLNASNAIAASEQHTQVVRDMLETRIVEFEEPKFSRTSDWKTYKLIVKNCFKGGAHDTDSDNEILRMDTDDVGGRWYWVEGQYEAKPLYNFQDSREIDTDLLMGFGVNRLSVVGTTVPDYVYVPNCFGMAYVTFVSQFNNNVWQMAKVAGRPEVSVENDSADAAYMAELASAPDMYDFCVQHYLTSGGDNEYINVSLTPENYSVTMLTEPTVDWNVIYPTLLALYDYWDMAKEMSKDNR